MTVDLFPPGVTDESPEMGEDIDYICTEIHEACKGFGMCRAVCTYVAMRVLLRFSVLCVWFSWLCSVRR